MAAKRKTVKRGRKPGQANEWAFNALKATASKKDFTVLVSEAICFDGQGKVLDSKKSFTILASDKAIAAPRSLLLDSDQNASQIQTRIGAQVREGMKRAQVGASWESWDISEDIGVPEATVLMLVRK